MSTTYDASNIKILTQHEAEERFSWVYIENLAATYLRDKAWIALGLEACVQCKVPQEYFVEYYLKKNKETVYIPEVSEVYKELRDNYDTKVTAKLSDYIKEPNVANPSSLIDYI